MAQNWFVKILLFPFSVLYGVAISARNLFYETGLLRATKFNIPVISIGNLTIGGAGKTPHVEFLIRKFSPYLNVGTISRGYKRKTKGFRYVEKFNNALDVGDEPLMYKRKYPQLTVVVSESRALAVPLMLKTNPQLQAIILDDAFQHRGIIPGLNILLTTYAAPFTKDLLLPAGRLREFRGSYSRADIIIVSKCPYDMTQQDKTQFIKEINPKNHQKIFFTYYNYFPPYSFYNTAQRLELKENQDIILISAIADTNYLMEFLEEKVGSVHELSYEDHHLFQERDINYLQQVYKNRDTENKIILTTEKDAMRMDILRKQITDYKLPIFILPVEVKFLFDEENEFEDLVKSFFLNFKV
jgi:tetraacyldisaccharide 4'-kinase